MHVISSEVWWPRALAHARAAFERSQPRQVRRARGEKNALEDFLWEYYPLRPGRLAVWHPGFADDAEPYALLKPADDSGSVTPWQPGKEIPESPLSWWLHHASLPWHVTYETEDGTAIVVDPSLLPTDPTESHTSPRSIRYSLNAKPLSDAWAGTNGPWCIR